MGTKRVSFGRGVVVSGLLAALVLMVSQGWGAILFQEPFNTDTANTAETAAVYTNFNVTGTGNAYVSSGILYFSLINAGNTMTTKVGFPGDILIQLGVGKNPGGGSANVGLTIGANRLVFHPGYSGGAFRVEGPGGFGNQNMGFTPAAGPLHPLEVAVDSVNKQFTIAVTNASNPDQVYVARFTNAGYVPGTTGLGPTRSSGGGTDEVGLYDNLVVSELKPAMASTLWAQKIAASNPLNWYRLNEVGSAIAVDLGSAALHGVYRNGTLRGQAGVPEIADLAARFDGVDDQVWLGGAALSGQWSAEFILKHVAVEDAGSLIRSAAGALRLDQWQNTGRVGYTAFGVADYLVNPPLSVPLGEWCDLVFLGDPASGIQVYLNGALAASNPNYIPLPRDVIGGPDTANMILDEVVIYDRLLSLLEIREHAAANNLAIPEPASLALLAIGLTAIARRRATTRT